jgi:hypothetical protein
MDDRHVPAVDGSAVSRDGEGPSDRRAGRIGRVYPQARTGSIIIRRVNLEGSTFPAFDYGWVRPRRLAAFSPESVWLLGQCFCAACRRAAKDAGLDPEHLRRRILALLAEDLASVEVRAERSIQEVIGQEPEFAALIEVKRSSVDRFNRVVATKATEAGGGMTAFVPFEQTPEERIISDDVALALSGVRINPSVFDRLEEIEKVETRIGKRLETSLFLPDVGTAPSGMELKSEAVLEYVRRAASSGVDEVALYHYGLLQPEVFEALVQAAKGGVAK